MCNRLIESYNKNLAYKKAEGLGKFHSVINNKQNILKHIFITNLKARSKIENLMHKYIKGYSRDKIRRKKLRLSTSHNSANRDLSDPQANCLNNNSNSVFSNSQSNWNFKINGSSTRLDNNNNIMNNNNFTQSLYNNTSGSFGNSKHLFYTSCTNMNQNSPYCNKTISSNSGEPNQNFKNGYKSNSRFNIQQIIPSRELKELKELEECTFQPKIKLYYPAINNIRHNTSSNEDYESYLDSNTVGRYNVLF